MHRNTFNRLLGLACLTVALPVWAGPLDENEQRMVEWIDAQAEDAISLVEETVNISSGTMNHEGIRAVRDVMIRELDSLGLETEWIELPPEMDRAGHLFGRKMSGSGKKFVLIGHLDTVFEADDNFQAFQRDGDIATGPGVEDMKGGNAVIIYALKALQEIGALDSIPVVVAYTGEEEKPGRPLSVSRKELVAAGQWADIGLGFESATLETSGSLRSRSRTSPIMNSIAGQPIAVNVMSTSTWPSASRTRIP